MVNRYIFTYCIYFYFKPLFISLHLFVSQIGELKQLITKVFFPEKKFTNIVIPDKKY